MSAGYSTAYPGLTGAAAAGFCLYLFVMPETSGRARNEGGGEPKPAAA